LRHQTALLYSDQGFGLSENQGATKNFTARLKKQSLCHHKKATLFSTEPKQFDRTKAESRIVG